MRDSTFEKYKLVVDEWFINGFNGMKAYQKNYPKTSKETAMVNFSRMLTYAKVADYVATKSKDTADKLQITLEGQLLELNDIKTLAKNKSSYSDAINAIKEQNKLLALYKEHNEQKGKAFSLPLTEFFKTITSEDK